ncbi:hypothetical protein ACT6NV_04325 [Robiginitalea sp. IMCC44478]|uniref:hypothetical protein n=1 Tax=Robiginitalea sp. IMCC44478 TaxID=3459122 RepID=UPI0040418DB5
MKSIRHYLILFALPALILYSITACSSDDSDTQRTELNILVIDADSNDPLANALVQVCNNPYFCTNVLTSGTTDAAGKIRLSLSESDMSIAQSFTVFRDNYMNSTSFLEGLDLSKEIVIRLRTY